MRKFALYFAVLLCGVSPALLAQSRGREPSRQLSGSLVFGWSQTTGREFFEERRRNPFTTLRLDYRSFLSNPNFLTYNVRGRLSSGFQDGFSGTSEGSGVAFDTTFLPNRPWPFHFYYSRFRRSALTSGLSSSYSRFVTKNDDSALGFQWLYSVPKRPALSLSFDKISTSSTPETVLTQGFETRARTFTLGVRDRRLGWLLNGNASWQRADTNYLLGSERGNVLLNYKNNIQNLTVQAQRPIRKAATLTFSGNRSASKSDFDRGRLDQTFESLSGRFEYTPGRLQTWTQARLTRSTLDSRPSPLLGGPVFFAPSTRISNRQWDSGVRYQLRPYLSFFGRSEFTQVDAPDSTGIQRPGNSWNAVSGAQFFHDGKSFSLGGSYSLYTTLNRLQRDAHSKLLGHAVDVTASVGDPSRLRLSALFMLSRSQEDARNLFFATSDTDRGQLTLSRALWHRWILELHGGASRVRYHRGDFRSDFLTQDYGVSLRGDRFYLGYSRNIGSGDSLQPLFRLPVTPPTEPGSPLTLAVGSSTSSTNLDGSWNLNHSLVLRGVWRRQAQTVGPALTSRFEQQEATLEWSFRKLRFEAGYLVYRYNFGSPIFRKSIIFRVTRDFRLF